LLLKKGIWNGAGLKDFNNFHKARRRHGKTRSHLHAITALKTFGFIRINTQLDEQRWRDIAIHNGNVKKNRH
jgi:hypothetical protein